MKLERSQRGALVTWFVTTLGSMMSDAEDDQTRVKNALKILAGEKVSPYNVYATAHNLLGPDIRFVFAGPEAILAAHLKNNEQITNAKLYLLQLCKIAAGEELDLKAVGNIMATADAALPGLVAAAAAKPTTPAIAAAVLASAPAAGGAGAPPLGRTSTISAATLSSLMPPPLIKLPVLVAVKTRVGSQGAYNFLFTGSSDSDKTQFVRACADPMLPESALLFSSSKLCRVTDGDDIKKLWLSDTAGQERFRSLTPATYRSSDAVFVMPDNDPDYFNSLALVEAIRDRCAEHLPDCNWYTISYSGEELALAPYTRENLAEALASNEVPSDPRAVGLTLLKKVTALFSPSPAAVSAATPSTGLLGVFSSFFGSTASTSSAAPSTSTAPTSGP